MPADPITEREKTLASVFYNSRTGFGSVEHTLKAARQHDRTITREHVRAFVAKQEIKQRRKPARTNSFVADTPRQEFQVDLLDMGERSQPRYGFIAIDIFSKKGACFPIPDKTAPGTAAALHKTFGELGYPASIMCDEGGEFHGEFSKLCKDEDIELLYSRTGGRFVERFIRSVKIAIFNTRKTLGGNWTSDVQDVIDTCNESAHTSTKYTPDHINENEYDYPLIAKARDNIQSKAHFNANHPTINIGDHVKIRIKPSGYGDYKETFNSWSHEVYTVSDIVDGDQGELYHLNGYRRPLLRFELLRVGDVHRWVGGQLQSVLAQVQHPVVAGAVVHHPPPVPPPVHRPITRSVSAAAAASNPRALGLPARPGSAAAAASAIRRPIT